MYRSFVRRKQNPASAVISCGYELKKGHTTFEFPTREQAKQGVETLLANYPSYELHGYDAFVMDMDNLVVVETARKGAPVNEIPWQRSW